MKAIQQIIEALGREEGFSTVVLTNASGLTLATSEASPEAEALAAIVADILRAASGISERLHWTTMSEIMLLAEDSQRGLLCRRFTAGGRELVLAVFIRPHHAYWQATTRAIRDIQAIWQRE